LGFPNAVSLFHRQGIDLPRYSEREIDFGSLNIAANEYLVIGIFFTLEYSQAMAATAANAATMNAIMIFFISFL